MFALFYLGGEDNPFYGQMLGPFDTAQEAMKFADDIFANDEEEMIEEGYYSLPLPWSKDTNSKVESWSTDDGHGNGCYMVQKLTKEI